jgi:hypothetical protein
MSGEIIIISFGEGTAKHVWGDYHHSSGETLAEVSEHDLLLLTMFYTYFQAKKKANGVRWCGGQVQSIQYAFRARRK